jgi:serine/threonine protein kinase/tetratricopeptide (TPR) repeat protein
MEVPKEELTTGTSFAGRYQIIEELGKGGMGRVYKANDIDVNEKVAIKLIKPNISSDIRTIERFQNELKFARKIRHKNVCQMYDLNREKGIYYITMEYVEGENLKNMIRMSRQLAKGTTISIARQICGGLAEAHNLGVVHRDLKPSNIMIDREGNVRIMDFGIARSLKEKGITGAGVMIGTPEYMSPEQVEGKEVDQRSDIYSLGIILYEMVTGRVPFEGDTALSIAMKHKSEAPKDPKEYNAQIPDDMSHLILKCLEKDRDSRFQSVEEMKIELENIEKSIPIKDREIPRKKPLTSKEITVTFGLKKLLIPTLLFLGIVIIGIAVWQLLTHKETPAAQEKTRLAVLPFENLGSPEDEYFADGIMDEIIARITNVTNLSVIARNSAIQYKDTKKTITEIGDELGVDYILSGTVRWQKSVTEPGRVRVTPSLIRVTDVTQIWAEVYDESFTEVFIVQSDISKQVVNALGIALFEPEMKALEARPTRNMEAYDYYLRGQDYFYRRRGQEKENRLAIEMFEKAVDLDPNFLQAYVQLAIVQINCYWYHFDRSEERVAKAKQAADKASQIDPDSAEAHTAWGYYFYHGKLDYVQALMHFNIALKKQPKNPEVLEGIAYVKRRQGELAESVIHLTAAAEIDPRSPAIALNLGDSYALMRNYQDAGKWYDRALFLNLEYPNAYYWKARMLLNRGDTTKARKVLEAAAQTLGESHPLLITYHWILVDIHERKYDAALQRLSSVLEEAFSDQFFFVPIDNLFAHIYSLMNNDQMAKKHYQSAVRLLEEKIKEDPEDSRYYSALGITYAGLDKKEEAVQAAQKATEILPISKEAWRGTFRAIDLAQVYARVGEYDKSLDLIERLLSIPGEISVPLLRTDPVWIPLHSHPRFQKLTE